MKFRNLFGFAIITLVLLCSNTVFAQEIEKLGIISYTPPKGWQKEVQSRAVQFGTQNSDGGICLITMFKPLPGSNDPKTNFDSAWEAIVKETISDVGAPQMQTATSENGWTAESGFANYESDGRKGVAMLITMSGDDKMVNIFILTNSDAFQQNIQQFLASIDLTAVQMQARPTPQKTQNDSSARLAGKWHRSGAVPPPYSGGYGGYIKFRYEFKTNGAYVYTQRVSLMISKTILITKESGDYSVNGNQINIIPNKRVFETYAKDNRADSLGELLKSQNRQLEKTFYTFTFQYFSGLQDWNLVLQAERPTNRDGAFSTNKTFPNAWYFDEKFTDNDLTSKTGK